MKKWTVKQVYVVVLVGKGREEHRIGRMAVGSGGSSFFNALFSLSLQGFTVNTFRQMCILAGCDYLSSVHGIGLCKASKLLRKHNKNPTQVMNGVQGQSGAYSAFFNPITSHMHIILTLTHTHHSHSYIHTPHTNTCTRRCILTHTHTDILITTTKKKEEKVE